MQLGAQVITIICFFGAFVFIGDLLRISLNDALGGPPLRDRTGGGE